jgi:tripartite ATP-independent transporter DctM subunit
LLLRKVPAASACITTVAATFFGAISGSAPATAAAIGGAMIPAMKANGYRPEEAAAINAASGTIGIIIPPSAPMIVYGIIAEQSIGRLFAAGIIPGVILTVLLCLTVVVLVKCNPALASKGENFTWRERFASLKDLFWMFVLFAGVFYSMFSGIFTINEAAAGGAFLAMLITLITGKLDFKTFMAVMKDTVKTTSMTYLLLIGAVIFGNFLAITRLPMTMANTIASLQISRYLIFTFIVVIYLVLGCLMDALPMIMLTVPIFLPIVTTLGFDPIWFGVMIIFVMQLGLITPPVGMNCYVISGIARDVPLQTIFRGSAPFIIPLLLAIAVCTAFPILATWLPTVFYG